MKRLFEELRGTLSSFLEQRQQAFLVLTCTDADTAYALKSLEEVEQDDSPHAFWMFAHNFETPAGYVEQAVQTVRGQVEALRKAVAQSEEPLEAPPELPAALLRPTEPVARLRALLTYLRELADAPEHCVACGLLPLRVLDAEAYLRFVHGLMQHEWPVPWFHHLRLFVRQDAAAPLLSQHLGRAERTDWYALDFGPDKLEQALCDQAADESENTELRMQAYLMLAAMDYAHQRYLPAMQKYGLLTRFYRKTQNLPLLALCLNGMGEVFARSGNHRSAREYFETALTPAIDAKGAGLAVLVNIALNLGNLHLSRQELPTAIAYYEGVAKLATAMCNVQLMLQVREAQGNCHLALGEHHEAWTRWQEGVKLARSLSDDVYQERLLLRLLALYEELRMTDQVYLTREELRILRERGPEVLQPLARKGVYRGH